MEGRVDELLNCMEQIKRLLILGLMRNGASQSEIAKSLGINQSSISRLFANDPGRKAKSK